MFYRKKSGLFLTCLMTLSVTLSGCSRTIKVKSLQPAEIARAASLKRIAVLKFKGDKYGLSGKMEALLAKASIDGQPYFTVVSRSHIDRITREQRFQYSGLLNEQHSVELGELLGAQALIFGEVTAATKNDSQYDAVRLKCKDEKCKALTTYTVSCTKRRMHLEASVQIIDVTRGDIIYSEVMDKSGVWSQCPKEQTALPSQSRGLSQLASQMTKDFVYKLTPHYKTSAVYLLETPDMAYTQRQQEQLKYSFDYLEAGRLKKAEKLLTQLFQSTNFNSYVAAYNLGVTKEALGLYEEARRYYQIADELQIKPVDEINQAIVRIEKLIQQREQGLRQIQR